MNAGLRNTVNMASLEIAVEERLIKIMIVSINFVYYLLVAMYIIQVGP